MRAPLLALVIAASLASPEARAESFALIVGHNGSHDPDNPTLAYADDDALRAAEALRTLLPAENVVVLTEPDEDTRRLFGPAANDARAPSLRRLRAAVRDLAARIARARAAGRPTQVYFLYSGHGDVDGGQAYLDLLDQRLSARALESEVIEALPADRLHLVIDSCNSYYLLSPRGPGGIRYALPQKAWRGFFARHPNVGVFLSTSAATEVFEWSELQSGIFSHEVRSGLLGAADGDGDGRVTYAELAAFVTVANQDLVNERYRPRIFARAPASGGDNLFELGDRADLRLPPAYTGRFYVQDDRGLRTAEFHKAAGRPLRLRLPDLDHRQYFLHRIKGRLGGAAGPTSVEELRLEPGPDGLALTAAISSLRVRGAESAVFEALFITPFSAGAQRAAGARRVSTPPRRAPVHGPTLSAGVESGHLAGLVPVTSVALGYRYAVDRWSGEARFGFGFALGNQDRDLTYGFSRYALTLAPRYDLPFGPVALTLGAELEAALEQQETSVPSVGPGGEPRTTEAIFRAVSGRWAGVVGVLWTPASVWQLGLEGFGGGRLLEVGGAARHRFTAGARLAVYWML